MSKFFFKTFIFFIFVTIFCKNIFSNEISNKVFFLNFKTSELVFPLKKTKKKIATLSDDLIVKPDIYSIYGSSYNLKKEGLYRIIKFPQNNRQIIVYKEDVHSLMSSISWMISHGTKSFKNIDELVNKAKRKKN